MFGKIVRQFISKSQKSYGQTYIMDIAKANWMTKDYKKLASEAYMKNVIAHRAISMISTSAASVDWALFKKGIRGNIRKDKHVILDLLNHPNPLQNGKEFMEMVYSYRQISGNVYILVVKGRARPIELYALRPDRVKIITDTETGVPMLYRYQSGKQILDFPIDVISGYSDLLHIKTFHPLSDLYGLSAIESAAYSIDQHNWAGEWNQALLQNGARPSGAIIVGGKNGGKNLTDQQYQQLKSMVKESFSGARNAGAPLILEGGLQWQEMSLSPKDMDFIQTKHSSARDIALALGMPPQLLGIPGDNTYSNLQEARLALWEQTIIPMVQNVTEKINNWLSPNYGDDLLLSFDLDNVSALSAKRDDLWKRIDQCSFLTTNEKRQIVGLSPIQNDDTARQL